MTCVVGVAHGGTVWIGADSAASGEDAVVSYKSPKVFRRGGFLFGVVSSFRMRDILHHDLQITRRRPGLADEKYLVQYVVEDIRGAFEAAKFDLEEEGDDAESGAVLIGYHGRLWTMDWDFHLGETLDGYTAIGTGAPYALGALHALKDIKLLGALNTEIGPLGPRQRVARVLAASAHCSKTVRPPFRILSIR